MAILESQFFVYCVVFYGSYDLVVLFSLELFLEYQAGVKIVNDFVIY